MPIALKPRFLAAIRVDPEPLTKYFIFMYNNCMIETTCKKCDKNFLTKPYRIKNGKIFCSVNCKRDGKSIQCFQCDTQFYRRTSHQRGKNQFCSKECSLKNTAFKKLHEPWNKDMKGIHLSPGSEFKKGKTSMTKADIGTVKFRTRKREGYARAFIKVAPPNKWIERAKLVWITFNGVIPKGYVIHHKDRNPLNDSIDNLACLSRKDHIDEHRQDLSSS